MLYAPSSRVLVHGPRCATPEVPLSSQQIEEWERQARAIARLVPRRTEFEKLPDYPVPVDIWHTCGPTCGCSYNLDGIPLARRK